MDLLDRNGEPLPDAFNNLDLLTPFATVYRYDVYDGEEPFDRRRALELVHALHAWIAGRITSRPPAA